MRQRLSYLATITGSIWRSKGEAFKPKNTIPSVKHGDGGSIVLCFAASGTSTFDKVDGIMIKEDYVSFQPHLKSTARRLKL